MATLAGQQNGDNVFSTDSQIYEAMSDYTNSGAVATVDTTSVDHNISDSFNFESNQSFFESHNDMMNGSDGDNAVEANDMQMDGESNIDDISIQSLPQSQTSKGEQFFGSFSQPTNTSHEYNHPIATTSIAYVQSSNYWTQSSLINSVHQSSSQTRKESSLCSQPIDSTVLKPKITKNGVYPSVASISESHVSQKTSTGAPTRKKRKNGSPVRPVCPDCGKEFSNQSALSKHKLTHSDERRFVCNQCSKAFKRQDHLNGHLLTHRSKKPYECDVEGCEKTYCDARSLRRHKENHHPQGSNNGQNPSLQTLAFIPAGIALNFSTAANLGLSPNQSLNRIQYAPPPPPPSTVTTGNGGTGLVGVCTTEQSAATQLQRLALHKQDDNVHNNNNTQNEHKSWVSATHEGPSVAQKWNQNLVLNKNSFVTNNNEVTKETLKSELYNKLQAISNLSDSSPETALLHQLLTQEQLKSKQQFYQLPHEESSHQHSSQETPHRNHVHHSHHKSISQSSTTHPLSLTQQESHLHQQHQHKHENSASKPSVQLPIQSLPQLESSHQSLSADMWPYTMFAPNNRSEPQVVECSLCQRKFKNIPALNGHMRLHGGYLKNQTPNGSANQSSLNSKKDTVAKADNSQVNANVKAILDVIKEKISRKQANNSSLVNHSNSHLLPPPPPPQSSQISQQQSSSAQHIVSQMLTNSHHQQQHHHQVIHSPMAPILSPVTPVTPKTADNNNQTFSYDFHPTSANNEMQFNREEHDLFYENDLLLLREQLQQSQQFRIPSQPSNVSNRLIGGGMEQLQHHNHHPHHMRRHSDSSDLSVGGVESNISKQTSSSSSTNNDCYSSQQSFNDLLRRRTQRTCSDPGDQPLMTINTSYQSSHQMYGHHYYNQSHSVPTTPTLCHNGSAPNNFQPHSLPSTPTAAAAPITFTHSPHQPQQQNVGSVPNTPTDANQQFNFMTVPSPINQGSVHSQHTQYSASPVSVSAQYSPNTPYSPSHTSVPQFTYHVNTSGVGQQSQQQSTIATLAEQQNDENVFSTESQMYDALTDYTNSSAIATVDTTSVEHNISDSFNFESNQSFFESHNDMMSENDGTGGGSAPEGNDMQSTIDDISIQSLPQSQTSKAEQFFGNFSQPTNTNHEYNHPIATTSISYVQSSNYWTQSSLINGVNHSSAQTRKESSVCSQPIDSTVMRPKLTTNGLYPSVASMSGNQLNRMSNIEYMFSNGMMASAEHQICGRNSLPLNNERRSTSSPPQLVVNLEKIDECSEEATDDVFLSPVGVAPSPKRTSPVLPALGANTPSGCSSTSSPSSSKRLKHRPEPLYIPPHVNTCGYQSRLRSPRLWDPCAVVDTKNLSPPPYTPPPMLSPVRSGTGLFWHIISGCMTPKSGTITPKFVYSRKSSVEIKEKTTEEVFSSQQSSIAQTPTTAYEPFDCEIPETDVQPHVNIGPTFQARIPAFNANKDEAKLRSEKADLVWDPSLADTLSDEDIETYLELSCCACVPGSGRNKEYAMHLLYIARGDIQNAIVKLLEPHPTIAEGHPLADYHYPENDIWVPTEIESYQNALNKCDKDFFSVAKEVGTKSVKQCIQFYYMWKKVCPDDYRRLRVIRRKREHETYFYNLRSKENEENNNNNNNNETINNSNDIKLDFETDNNTEIEMNGLSTNSAQSSDIDDNILSLIDSTNPSPATSVGSQIALNNSNNNSNSVPECSYPCKLCGKVFQKVKSRSAHMKIHGSGSAKY